MTSFSPITPRVIPRSGAPVDTSNEAMWRQAQEVVGRIMSTAGVVAESRQRSLREDIAAEQQKQQDVADRSREETLRAQQERARLHKERGEVLFAADKLRRQYDRLVEIERGNIESALAANGGDPAEALRLLPGVRDKNNQKYLIAQGSRAIAANMMPGIHAKIESGEADGKDPSDIVADSMKFLQVKNISPENSPEAYNAIASILLYQTTGLVSEHVLKTARTERAAAADRAIFDAKKVGLGWFFDGIGEQMSAPQYWSNMSSAMKMAGRPTPEIDAAELTAQLFVKEVLSNSNIPTSKKKEKLNQLLTSDGISDDMRQALKVTFGSGQVHEMIDAAEQSEMAAHFNLHERNSRAGMSLAVQNGDMPLARQIVARAEEVTKQFGETPLAADALSLYTDLKDQLELVDTSRSRIVEMELGINANEIDLSKYSGMPDAIDNAFHQHVAEAANSGLSYDEALLSTTSKFFSLNAQVWQGFREMVKDMASKPERFRATAELVSRVGMEDPVQAAVLLQEINSPTLGSLVNAMSYEMRRGRIAMSPEIVSLFSDPMALEALSHVAYDSVGSISGESVAQFAKTGFSADPDASKELGKLVGAQKGAGEFIIPTPGSLSYGDPVVHQKMNEAITLASKDLIGNPYNPNVVFMSVSNNLPPEENGRRNGAIAAMLSNPPKDFVDDVKSRFDVEWLKLARQAGTDMPMHGERAAAMSQQAVRNAVLSTIRDYNAVHYRGNVALIPAEYTMTGSAATRAMPPPHQMLETLIDKVDNLYMSGNFFSKGTGSWVIPQFAKDILSADNQVTGFWVYDRGNQSGKLYKAGTEMFKKLNVESMAGTRTGVVPWKTLPRGNNSQSLANYLAATKRGNVNAYEEVRKGFDMAIAWRIFAEDGVSLHEQLAGAAGDTEKTVAIVERMNQEAEELAQGLGWSSSGIDFGFSVLGFSGGLRNWMQRSFRSSSR